MNYSNFLRGSRKPSFFAFLKMFFRTKDRSNVKKLKSHIPFIKADLHKIHHPGKQPQVTWLGHSSLLLQAEGLNILLDPVFSTSASPVQLLGPKRYTPPPIKLQDLPPIDMILISHDHYDHLDLRTVKHFRNKVEWIVPKGLAQWFAKLKITNVHELGWWESYKMITSTPSQHWSKRGFFDTFRSLWCSYVLEFDGFKFYFGADTGFNEEFFQQIADKFAPFDLAALPIGAYDPEWFMHPFHINPEEAIKIHNLIQSKRSIPIHWGTFRLTFEPITEPIERLKKAHPENFEPIAIGATLILPEPL